MCHLQNRLFQNVVAEHIFIRSLYHKDSGADMRHFYVYMCIYIYIYTYGFFKQLLQNTPYKAENCHASLYENTFSTRRFIAICPWVLKLPHHPTKKCVLYFDPTASRARFWWFGSGIQPKQQQYNAISQNTISIFCVLFVLS